MVDKHDATSPPANQSTRLPARSIRVSNADWQLWQAYARKAELPLSTWIKQTIKVEIERLKAKQRRQGAR